MDNLVVDKNDQLYLIDLDEIYYSYSQITAISFIVTEFDKKAICKKLWENLLKNQSVKFLKNLIIFRSIKGLNHSNTNPDKFVNNNQNALLFALSKNNHL